MNLRSLVALAVVSASAAGPAAAQMREPNPLGPASQTRGPSFGLNLNGSELGAGATLGYGLGSAFTVFTRAGYAYQNSYVDAGARYSFGRESSELRPYLEGALTYAGEARHGMHSRGFGGTAMIGAEYFISPKLALDVGVGSSRGRITSFKLDGEELDLESYYSSPRINVGVKWHP